MNWQKLGLLQALVVAVAASAWGPAAANPAAARAGASVVRSLASGLGGGGAGSSFGSSRTGGDDREFREVRFVPSFRAARTVEGIVHDREDGSMQRERSGVY